MRILIAESSQYIAFHGQAIFTINLAEGLAGRGHEVLVVAGSERGAAYCAWRHGVHVEAVRSLSLRAFHPDSSWPFYPHGPVENIFDSFRPEVVHIQDHYPISRAVVLAANKLGIKSVGTNHFMPENLAPYVPLLSKVKPIYNRVLWSWMQETYNRLDAVASPSRTAARLVHAAGLKQAVFPISCGVDTHLFRPDLDVDRSYWRGHYGIDPERKIFFFVGRVDKEKRLDVLVNAFHLLQREDVQLVVAGKGAALTWIEELARKLGLGEKIRFTGFIPNEDLPAVLNSIDVFVMPSEAELLSISSLEAMACSRPLLVARAVALPELVDENVNGLLFTPGDVSDAARCLDWFADNPERWAAMGAASLEKVQLHSLENTISLYERLYELLLKDVSLLEFLPRPESG
jgi:1,2-diacylglycerol 3-alpha-glucosyltransferase